MSILSGVMGVGVLSMPYVFLRAGLIAAPLIVLVVLCSAYTAHLLVWALEAQPSLLTASDFKGIAPDFFLERACALSRSKLYSWGCQRLSGAGDMGIFVELHRWGFHEHQPNFWR